MPRRRKRYVFNIKRLILSGLLLSLVIEVVIAAFNSPWFYVRHIRPTGNSIIPSAEVRKRLNIKKDDNIFLIDKSVLTKRIVENPVVKDIQLHRRLPDTLIVKVIERKPDLILSTRETLYEVDSMGVPFRIVKSGNENLPVIFCEVPGRITLGKPLHGSTFDVARKCLLLAREKKIFHITNLIVDQSGNLCLNVRDGYQVKLGKPYRLADKLYNAALTVEQIPEFRQHGEYVDVSVPEAPALKFEE